MPEEAIARSHGAVASSGFLRFIGFAQLSESPFPRFVIGVSTTRLLRLFLSGS